jgi:predicted metal-binding protein
VHKLFICQTCNRNVGLASGARSRGALLTQAFEEALESEPLDDVIIVRVECLSACLNPCNVAFRAARKYSLRFSRITPVEVPAILQLLVAYMQHETGDVPVEDWPQGLEGRLSARYAAPHELLG